MTILSMPGRHPGSQITPPFVPPPPSDPVPPPPPSSDPSSPIDRITPAKLIHLETPRQGFQPHHASQAEQFRQNHYSNSYYQGDPGHRGTWPNDHRQPNSRWNPIGNGSGPRQPPFHPTPYVQNNRHTGHGGYGGYDGTSYTTPDRPNQSLVYPTPPPDTPLPAQNHSTPKYGPNSNPNRKRWGGSFYHPDQGDQSSFPGWNESERTSIQL